MNKLNNHSLDKMTATPPNWLDATKVYKKCPYCKKGMLDTRVKRSRIVKILLFFVEIKRYACNNCQRKVYMRG